MTKYDLKQQYNAETGFYFDLFNPDDYLIWIEDMLLEKLNQEKEVEKLFIEEVNQEYVG